jgi:amino acid transporter
MAEAGGAHDRDEQKLAELGYKQELDRGWSRFSNFAISFTIISVLAGCFTTYGQAWNLGGPIAISWGWPIVVLIIMTVALSMAELASAYPTAGGPYWWAHRLGGKGWSWFTGWFNVVGLIAVVASVDYACAFFAHTLFGLWGLDLGFINFGDAAHILPEIFWLFALILVLHALINIYSSHLVALFNNISVFWHVVGVLVIIAILIIVPDSHQSFDFVFTEKINSSGFLGGDTGGLFFWLYILPTGLLLTMYTVTGYDASAHVAEETKDAEISAAKGIWQSVALSGLIGWFVLLAITFAASDVTAVNDAFGTSLSVFSSSMSEGWAETVILISTIGQFFCGMACVTSCSRTFFAFSRDRATPGWRLWSRVDGARRVPVAAVLGSCLFAFILLIPALFASDAFVPPVAFYAVTSVAVIGLYIAYVVPVYLRWRAGSSFQQGAWNLGEKWRWLNPIAVIWVLLTSIVFCLPFYSTGVPWESDFDWNSFNYTPLTVGVTALLAGLAWMLGMKDRYTGPVRQIEFDDAVGIKDIEPEEPGPPAPPPPAAPR